MAGLLEKYQFKNSIYFMKIDGIIIQKTNDMLKKYYFEGTFKNEDFDTKVNVKYKIYDFRYQLDDIPDSTPYDSKFYLNKI